MASNVSADEPQRVLSGALSWDWRYGIMVFK